MLTLSRRVGERVLIGSTIEIEVVSVTGGRVRLGIRAPRAYPIQRGELMEKIEVETKRAAIERASDPSETGPEIVFCEGILGLSGHDTFKLYDISARSPFRMLEATSAAGICLLVVPVREVYEAYPEEEARSLADLDQGEEAVVFAIASAPANGEPLTVNLSAPLVVSLESFRGKQVVLDREELQLRHPLALTARPSVPPPPSPTAAPDLRLCEDAACS